MPCTRYAKQKHNTKQNVNVLPLSFITTKLSQKVDDLISSLKIMCSKTLHRLHILIQFSQTTGEVLSDCSEGVWLLWCCSLHLSSCALRVYRGWCWAVMCSSALLKLSVCMCLPVQPEPSLHLSLSLSVAFSSVLMSRDSDITLNR